MHRCTQLALVEALYMLLLCRFNSLLSAGSTCGCWADPKYTCAGEVLVIRLAARNAMVVMVQGIGNRDLAAALGGFGLCCVSALGEVQAGDCRACESA